jgi:very-short-patch-repair endonuclease
LVVEVNGGQHYDEPGIERDAVRDAFLMDQGLEVLRFSNRDVLESTEGVVEAIRIAVERRLQD